ncbi:hypothetical protein PNEG_00593 [Pneumocystis murina B123]|uniref:Uncharacterized protein n=1 Tax=Pneumocystis murina (strain B123) TaxID=1069680 RepID=M7NV38_PNEMU|nr:hypothetical protein PNEG_00593 [Pneumocystis murina B123]EMR10991.1 hypothetical protein PNEG_00593 [Pneumocystis murina B123]
MNAVPTSQDINRQAKIQGKEQRIIEVPLKEQGQLVEIDCTTLPEDAEELCEILECESASKEFWIQFSYEYRRQGYIDQAIHILIRGLKVDMQKENKLPLYSMLAALYLEKARRAPRTEDQKEFSSEAHTKDYYHQMATQALNEANRIDFSFLPNILTRAVWNIMRSSGEKSLIDQAGKYFDDILIADPRNLFAMLGKARILFSRKNYVGSLKLYQTILSSKPDFVLDPRIGIGLCFWKLNMKENAKASWLRSLELNEKNVSANTLLSLYYLDSASSKTGTSEFLEEYEKSLKYAQNAYKQSQTDPYSANILASYFFSKRNMDMTIKLSEKALKYADTNYLINNSLFLMARAYHYMENYEKASELYQHSYSIKDSRVISEIGMGQMKLIQDDIVGAKLIFEKITEQHPKCIEALTILGSIYTHEILSSNSRNDKSLERQKAKSLLERAIHLISNSEQREFSGSGIFITLAALCEEEDNNVSLESYERALDLERNFPTNILPQLLNNIGVLHHIKENFANARQFYQDALNQCVSMGQQENNTINIDALVTTLTYNLARCEEQAKNYEKAKKFYEELLQRHPDYVEARVRLCHMEIIKEGTENLSKKIKNLIEANPGNLDVRAYFGWYLSRQKWNKTSGDNPEQKHYTHTLKYFDKHDRYSLTAMGNIHLRIAQEFRPTTDAEKEKKHKMYEKAVEFFDKALQLDPKNAYAAQGIAIALAENKQHTKALLILSKIRETLKNETVYINMGHCLTEMKQYPRAIEAYELALNEYQNGSDLMTFSALGKVWLQKGKEERNLSALKEALKFTEKALKLQPSNTAIIFNIAFIQFKFAEIARTLPENKRSIEDLKYALENLDNAIKTFSNLANSKYPPYPKEDIQQRANMGRNTTLRQLERAIQQQKEFESNNLAKLDSARQKRKEEQEKRNAEAEALRVSEEKRQKELTEERRLMQEQVKEWAMKKKEEYEMAEHDIERNKDPNDQGKSKKRNKLKKNRQKKIENKESEPFNPETNEHDTHDDEKQEKTISEQPKKRRKLSKINSKREIIDSDDQVENEEKEVPDIYNNKSNTEEHKENTMIEHETSYTVEDKKNNVLEYRTLNTIEHKTDNSMEYEPSEIVEYDTFDLYGTEDNDEV